MNPLLIGGILDKVAGLADDLFTSDEERLKMAAETMKIEAGLLQGQMEVNKVEAAHESVFVAGWRPAIGWVGAASLGYQFLLYPLMVWGWAALKAKGMVPADMEAPPLLDTEALWVLLTGMLGIAGMRTVEKVKKR
jgi:hypothetical protein